MIRIAVCDDDSNVRAFICRYLRARQSQLQAEPLHILVYESGKAFLAAVEDGMSFHIVFMDIQMECMSGVEVGKMLRSKEGGYDPIIIYVSSHDSYAQDLLHLAIFDFIRKPITEKELDETFHKALRQAAKYKHMVTPPLFSFREGAAIDTIPQAQIAYLKSVKRLMELYVWDSSTSAIVLSRKFYATIDGATAQLPENQFVRCERSHIVNLSYVRFAARDAFVLKDGAATEVPIGKIYKDDVKKVFHKYLEGML